MRWGAGLLALLALGCARVPTVPGATSGRSVASDCYLFEDGDTVAVVCTIQLGSMDEAWDRALELPYATPAGDQVIVVMGKDPPFRDRIRDALLDAM